jgi:ABC-type multidrug transport system ATPase subunit
MLEVRNTADRILIMDRGKLLEDGGLETILKKHGVSGFEELYYQLIKKENQNG